MVESACGGRSEEEDLPACVAELAVGTGTEDDVADEVWHWSVGWKRGAECAWGGGETDSCGSGKRDQAGAGRGGRRCVEGGKERPWQKRQVRQGWRRSDGRYDLELANRLESMSGRNGFLFD